MEGTLISPAPKRTERTARLGITVTYRLAVASRFIVASLGGYLFASLFSVCVSQWLPLPRGEAVMAGMMLSFLAYLGVFIGCFACRTAWRAWTGVALGCAVLAVVWAAGRWLS
ncbi:DUF3649 domain-containing protein [Pseudomonas sp. DTU_2021_1001937_2_SI_NGA_ILE_001]|uniref:DUF3649 domain-containing protein n=1 Tax=Pseudomonas sp. DTU_2021_1001937_2_SI_NGA_ILE_001 TaxID=3077589 RepID=UPI0028FC1E70|nr:DUF3649 domain-containing protein [Pseudomonas sp. DTU_2021_1001937_2_SI_NGA_ILE_001]WNW13520.1 DUF3649 domain-containing protein [Pseudomonas sp. DTU_2021_1001937_2_SI_NGA_ILE_001]